mmetsp:Transcript_16365/g.39166  ORF Transcript_16365/g.39166 Transcript_16365/m.39166 type:complete len:198 (-) Transcript_16365:217-810(-)
MPSSLSYFHLWAAAAASVSLQTAQSFSPPPPASTTNQRHLLPRRILALPPLRSSPTDTKPPAADGTATDYDPPEDAIIQIKPQAMARLVELKQKRDTNPKDPTADPASPLVLRMGVRNGGCSGLSYVMDFSSEDQIEEEDEVDSYEREGIRCVVDAKSLLYLYGLELDYSDELIGGGFKFFNPNAEESCGCGSSFGV